MLDVAEAELLREKVGAGDTAMPDFAEVAETTEFAAPLPPQLPALVALLASMVDGEQSTPIADAVVADGYRETAYRFSLLPLIGEPTTDPTLVDLASLPLRLRAGNPALLPVGRHGVAQIEDLYLESADE
jgi:hypothetical protein